MVPAIVVTLKAGDNLQPISKHYRELVRLDGCKGVPFNHAVGEG